MNLFLKTLLSPLRQRSSCREGSFQPDHQLWSSASGSSWRAASGHGAQRGVGEEVRPPHWPAAPRHGETHRVQDVPAGQLAVCGSCFRLLCEVLTFSSPSSDDPGSPLL